MSDHKSFIEFLNKADKNKLFSVLLSPSAIVAIMYHLEQAIMELRRKFRYCEFHDEEKSLEATLEMDLLQQTYQNICDQGVGIEQKDSLSVPWMYHCRTFTDGRTTTRFIAIARESVAKKIITEDKIKEVLRELQIYHGYHPGGYGGPHGISVDYKQDVVIFTWHCAGSCD